MAPVIFVLINGLLYILTIVSSDEVVDLSDPHRDPSKCEVCKYVAAELQGMLEDTGKSHEVIHIGHRFDTEKKQVKFIQSEVRLIEVLEGVCDRILEYNVHAERESSLRLSKGRSETMDTLWNLRNKGVKVELGIPENMWDVPSAPVTKMKQYCDYIIEEYEEFIQDWYFEEPSNDRPTLTSLLCVDRYLSNRDQECLTEVWTGKETNTDETGNEKNKNKNTKKKDGETNRKQNKKHSKKKDKHENESGLIKKRKKSTKRDKIEL